MVCPRSSSDALRLRSHLRRCKLDDHARQRGASRPFGHLTSGSDSNGLLRLDAEFLEPDDERSAGEETECKGNDVQEALVVYIG